MTDAQIRLKVFHSQLIWLWTEWQFGHDTSLYYFLSKPLQMQNLLRKRAKYNDQYHRVTYGQARNLNIRSPFVYRYSAVVMAICARKKDMVELLIKKGAVIGQYEMLVGMRHGCVEMFLVLVKGFQKETANIKKRRMRPRSPIRFQNADDQTTICEPNGTKSFQRIRCLTCKANHTKQSNAERIASPKCEADHNLVLMPEEKSMIDICINTRFINRILLDYCIIWNRYAIVNVILSNVKFPMKESNTLLVSLILHANLSLQELIFDNYPALIQKRIFVRDSKSSLIEYALKSRRIGTALMLLRKYNAPVVRSNKGSLPIHLCASCMMYTKCYSPVKPHHPSGKRQIIDNQGLSDIFQLFNELIKCNSDINQGDVEKRSVLHILVRHKLVNREIARCRIAAMQKLIAAGADVNALYRTNTALHFCASFGYIDAAKILLEAGADPWIRNEQGETCIDICAPAISQELTLAVKNAVRIPKLSQLCLVFLRKYRMLPDAWLQRKF